MKLNAMLTMVVVLGALNLRAQNFVTPLDGTSLGMSKSNRVTTNDDQVHEGKITFVSYANGLLSAFTLKLESGEKMKFKSEDVKLLETEPGKMQKLQMKSDSPTPFAAITKDYSYINELKYVIFQPVDVRGKVKLMQLLNPGLDDYISVYQDPFAKENQWTGQPNSYYVMKDSKAFFLKKNKYDDVFWELFSGCEKFKTVFDAELKFYDFPSHIALYNESCPKE